MTGSARSIVTTAGPNWNQIPKCIWSLPTDRGARKGDSPNAVNQPICTSANTIRKSLAMHII